MCILPIYLQLWYHKMLDYLQNLLMPFSICLDSYTHSMQHFDKHDPFTLLGLWYTSLEYPHVLIFLFYSAFYCTHRTVPTSGMEALLLLLDFLYKTTSFLWISSSPDCKSTRKEGQGLQTEEIGSKCQMFFISLLRGRRKQTTSIRLFFPFSIQN